MWFMPYLVCKYSFDGDHKPFWRFFLRGTLAVVLAATLCVWGCRGISLGGIAGCAARVLLCTAVFNAVYALCFCRSRQMHSIINLLKNILHLN